MVGDARGGTELEQPASDRVRSGVNLRTASHATSMNRTDGLRRLSPTEYDFATSTRLERLGCVTFLGCPPSDTWLEVWRSACAAAPIVERNRPGVGRCDHDRDRRGSWRGMSQAGQSNWSPGHRSTHSDAMLDARQRPGVVLRCPGLKPGSPGLEYRNPGLESGSPGLESGSPGHRFGCPGLGRLVSCLGDTPGRTRNARKQTGLERSSTGGWARLVREAV